MCDKQNNTEHKNNAGSHLEPVPNSRPGLPLCHLLSEENPRFHPFGGVGDQGQIQLLFELNGALILATTGRAIVCMFEVINPLLTRLDQ